MDLTIFTNLEPEAEALLLGGFILGLIILTVYIACKWPDAVDDLIEERSKDQGTSF